MTQNVSLSWEHLLHISHKVRNSVRRGYLLKTYYDKKLMQARIKTGHGIENDRIDIMHPVGYLGRVKPSDKAEVFTMDVGGDSSRRVVLGVLGDREHHPKILEGESILYSPGDPNKFMRVYKKPSDSGGGGGGGGKEGEDGGEGGGGEDSPDSKEAIYGKYDNTYMLADGKKVQTYYQDEKKSTQVDKDHIHIRFDDFRVWIDSKGIWTTKPILLKDDDHDGGGSTLAVKDERPKEYDLDEATNTWIYNTKMQFNGDVTVGAKTVLNGPAVLNGLTQFNGDVIFNRKANFTSDYLTLHADPILDMHAVPKRYVDGGTGTLTAGKVNKAGDTMSGLLVLSGDPVSDMHAVTKRAAVLKAGDTMTGMLALAADPAGDMDAVTKRYVDGSISGGGGGGGFLPIAGGTMTGPLVLAGPPTVDLNPVTKKYFEDKSIPEPDFQTTYARVGPATTGGKGSWVQITIPPTMRDGRQTFDGDVTFTGDVTFAGNVVIEGDLIVRGRIINASTS